MKRKKLFIGLTVLVFLIIQLIQLPLVRSNFESVFSQKSSKQFKEIIDHLYGGDKIRVLDQHNNDVTEEYIAKYKLSYDNKDYDKMYAEAANTYSFSWSSDNIFKTTD